MKIIPPIVTFLLTLLSCSDSYTIVGKVQEANDGDTIILAYSNDGKKIIETDISIVKNGTFKFEGKVDKSKVFYIGPKNCDNPAYTLFFLEKGEIEANLSKKGSVVVGTPLNDLNKEVTDSIEYYAQKIKSIEQKRYFCKHLKNGEFERQCVKEHKIQNCMTEYIRRTVSNNMHNIFGLYMLVIYHNFFNADELTIMAKSISKDLVDPNNNYLYDIIMEIDNARQTPENMEDFGNIVKDSY